MTTDKDLSLNFPYCIGEAAFEEIVRIFNPAKPRRIVEFGSGRSSIRLSQAFEDARIFSVEHNPEYLQKILELKEKSAIGQRLSFFLAPLRWQWIGMCLYKSYEQIELPKEIDAVIIDGPPASCFRGREACLYQIYDNLKVGGLIILDDYQREKEKQIVRNWISVFSGLHLREIQKGHGVVVLKKTEHQKPHWMAFSRLADNVKCILGAAARRVLDVLLFKKAKTV